MDDDVLRLAESRPDLELLGLGIEADPAIEVEPEVTFVRFVPEPGDEANSGAEADSPDTTPVPGNATCPVSDKPVDPAFTVVHEGRTIGFCCAKCPASFQADPAKYLAILDSK